MKVEDGSSFELLDLMRQDVAIRRVASTNGGEHAGPCPFCGGTDRFRVWPDHPSGTARWWCRQCNRSGDSIAYLVERGDITRAEAGRLRRGGSWRGATVQVGRLPGKQTPRPPERLMPPDPEWQQAASAFVAWCQGQLWTEPEALAWLHQRRLSNTTVKTAGLGWNPRDSRPDHKKWGFSEYCSLWLPRGWVIPWSIDGTLWRVDVRRPEGKPKYIGPKGNKNALYNAHALGADKPAILVEGVFDALTLEQEAGDIITPVATGSTSGARKPRWIAPLAMCPAVLVSFDADKAGSNAAAWWVNLLPNAKRWRPYWGDANAMAQAGVDLRDWVTSGLPA